AVPAGLRRGSERAKFELRKHGVGWAAILHPVHFTHGESSGSTQEVIWQQGITAVTLPLCSLAHTVSGTFGTPGRRAAVLPARGISHKTLDRRPRGGGFPADRLHDGVGQLVRVWQPSFLA